MAPKCSQIKALCLVRIGLNLEAWTGWCRTPQGKTAEAESVALPVEMLALLVKTSSSNVSFKLTTSTRKVENRWRQIGRDVLSKETGQRGHHLATLGGQNSAEPFLHPNSTGSRIDTCSGVATSF